MKKQVKKAKNGGRGKKLGLSAPWDYHMSMLSGFFRGDARYQVGYAEKTDEPGRFVGYVTAFDKKAFEALDQVLRKEMTWDGGLNTLRVEVTKGYEESSRGRKPAKAANDLVAMKTVLSGNPAFDRIKKTTGPFAHVNVIFKPSVLQWYSDNLGSPWQITTSVYEAEADKVFRGDIGVVFATSPYRD